MKKRREEDRKIVGDVLPSDLSKVGVIDEDTGDMWTGELSGSVGLR